MGWGRDSCDIVEVELNVSWWANVIGGEEKREINHAIQMFCLSSLWIVSSTQQDVVHWVDYDWE